MSSERDERLSKFADMHGLSNVSTDIRSLLADRDALDRALDVLEQDFEAFKVTAAELDADRHAKIAALEQAQRELAARTLEYETEREDHMQAEARAERLRAALEQIHAETKCASDVALLRMGSIARAALAPEVSRG